MTKWKLISVLVLVLVNVFRCHEGILVNAVDNIELLPANKLSSEIGQERSYGLKSLIQTFIHNGAPQQTEDVNLAVLTGNEPKVSEPSNESDVEDTSANSDVEQTDSVDQTTEYESVNGDQKTASESSSDLNRSDPSSNPLKVALDLLPDGMHPHGATQDVTKNKVEVLGKRENPSPSSLTENTVVEIQPVDETSADTESNALEESDVYDSDRNSETTAVKKGTLETDLTGENEPATFEKITEDAVGSISDGSEVKLAQTSTSFNEVKEPNLMVDVPSENEKENKVAIEKPTINTGSSDMENINKPVNIINPDTVERKEGDSKPTDTEENENKFIEPTVDTYNPEGMPEDRVQSVSSDATDVAVQRQTDMGMEEVDQSLEKESPVKEKSTVAPVAIPVRKNTSVKPVLSKIPQVQGLRRRNSMLSRFNGPKQGGKKRRKPKLSKKERRKRRKEKRKLRRLRRLRKNKKNRRRPNRKRPVNQRKSRNHRRPTRVDQRRPTLVDQRRPTRVDQRRPTRVEQRRPAHVDQRPADYRRQESHPLDLLNRFTGVNNGQGLRSERRSAIGGDGGGISGLSFLNQFVDVDGLMAKVEEAKRQQAAQKAAEEAAKKKAAEETEKNGQTASEEPTPPKA